MSASVHAILEGRPLSASTIITSLGSSTKPTSLIDNDVKGQDGLIRAVLEASATRRDAKGYLQKYASSGSAPAEAASQSSDPRSESKKPPNVAIVSIRLPKSLDEHTLQGVAKTLSQLRLLGLLSVVLLDCKETNDTQFCQSEALRMCEAIDAFGRPGGKLLANVFVRDEPAKHQTSGFVPNDLRVDDLGALHQSLEKGFIPVLPSIARHDLLSIASLTSSHGAVLALTRYLSGLQFPAKEYGDTQDSPVLPPTIASVERIILLDPLGGTPTTTRQGACLRFVNLEQEYDALHKHMEQFSFDERRSHSDLEPTPSHSSNLAVAKHALSLLPSSSSALITTPFAAANINNNMKGRAPTAYGEENTQSTGFNGLVTTRRRQNPLLHNLLTDKPMFSSSLPMPMVQKENSQGSLTEYSTAATLVKRGMPLTLFPDPRTRPWTPPKPGNPRLRLTDRCIDLPRLIYLIEDSFHRKMDVEDYLERLEDSLAGIIIAGEYEGGAILTWEVPEGLDAKTAYDTGRLIPYLDKFAVLKSRQGSGGVADIVFNSMVQDCFPEGVCWRSRKNNPVNKWYFERSSGTSKLPDSQWSMFWTTEGLTGRHPILKDYESVCRGVEPSWADNKHILE